MKSFLIKTMSPTRDIQDMLYVYAPTKHSNIWNFLLFYGKFRSGYVLQSASNNNLILPDSGHKLLTAPWGIPLTYPWPAP